MQLVEIPTQVIDNALLITSFPKTEGILQIGSHLGRQAPLSLSRER